MQKHRYTHWGIVVFLLAMALLASPAFSQCPGMETDTLARVDFEGGIPADWKAEAPTDGGAWQVDEGKIGYYTNPGQGKWLYLNDETEDNIGRGVFLSPDFDLSTYEGEVFFEMDLLFQAFEDSSFIMIEVWNGRDWMELLKLEEDFSGRLQFDLAGIQHSNVQFRFTYDDEGTWAWGMGMDNLLLYAIPTRCGNGICAPGESPENCPDCEQLGPPAPFWIEPGKDIDGKAATYTSFNHNAACDDCSQQIPLGFTFTFFDQPYTQAYLNTNGNLTFEGDFVEYTPSPFCLEGPRMIAPFFGDVDLTRGGEISLFLDPERHYMVVHWEKVAYYGCEGCDKRNTFQVILTDGSIKEINGNALPQNTTVIFNYGDMEWTTGSSSGGVDGLGGSAATVGMNLGDEVICIDYGTFDAEGYGYRGNTQELGCPPNEVSHLDFRSIALNGEDGSLAIDEPLVVPESDSLIIRYAEDKFSNLFFWEMEDSSYTREFVLYRGSSQENLREILRKKPGISYNSDLLRFELRDIAPLPEHNFYMIKEIRINGEENPSEVIMLNQSEDPVEKAVSTKFELISVGPIPFRDYLLINFRNPEGLEVKYILTNQLGQPLLKGSFGNQKGAIQKRLKLPGVQPGKYFLSIYYPGGREGVKLICQ